MNRWLLLFAISSVLIFLVIVASFWLSQNLSDIDSPPQGRGEWFFFILAVILVLPAMPTRLLLDALPFSVDVSYYLACGFAACFWGATLTMLMY